MTSRRTPSGTPRRGAGSTMPLLLGVELLRADVASHLFGLELGDAPCGAPITWALIIDGVVAGRTDEPMTDNAAQAWARRIVGEGVHFQLARTTGGYWLADADHGSQTRGGWSG